MKEIGMGTRRTERRGERGERSKEVAKGTEKETRKCEEGKLETYF